MSMIDYHIQRGQLWAKTRTCSLPASHTPQRQDWPHPSCFRERASFHRTCVAVRGKAQKRGIALHPAGYAACKNVTVITVPSQSVGVLGGHEYLMELHRMSRSRGGKRIDPVLTICGRYALQGGRVQVGSNDGAAYKADRNLMAFA